MNAYVGEIATNFDAMGGAKPGIRTRTNGPIVRSEDWGYALQAKDETGAGGIIALAFARFVGVILLICAVGLWIAPGALTGVEFLTMKLGASVLFVLLGGAMFWKGRDDGVPEVQVDTSRKVVRFGSRSRKGDYEDMATVPFERASSVHLSEDEDGEALLFIKVKDVTRGLQLAIGDPAVLSVLKKRVEADLAAAKGPQIGALPL